MAVLIVLLLVPLDAEGRPRDGAVRAFCEGSPDLCVFVCKGSRLDCYGMEDPGWICESRRGRLIVAEGDEVGGTVSTYEQDYSLCVYNTGGRYRTIWPDPEEIFVPEWPRNESGALCRMCGQTGAACVDRADSRRNVCMKRHTQYYAQYCGSTMRQYGWPKGRHGRDVAGKRARYCKRVLARGEDYWGSVFYWLAEYHRCHDRALAYCLEDFAASYPDESWENNIHLKVADYLGGGHTSTISWGGSRGYREACRMVGGIATAGCAKREAGCKEAADPKYACARHKEQKR